MTGHLAQSPAKQPGIRASRGARQHGSVGLCHQGRPRLVETDVAVDAKAENQEIDATGARDHGSGAPEYALTQVFDRFYSLPRTATGKKSSGLGLPLVREVARLHAGEADFANHPEGGALARLVLPLA